MSQHLSVCCKFLHFVFSLVMTEWIGAGGEAALKWEAVEVSVAEVMLGAVGERGRAVQREKGGGEEPQARKSLVFRGLKAAQWNWRE